MQTATTAATPGRRLRDIRVQRGLTQTVLATRAKVAPGTISHAELDKRQPLLLVQERIARALRVDRREIWPDEDAAVAV